jgi:tetratricopeptide (TPR) repeat protein
LLKKQPNNIGLVRDQAKGLSNLGRLHNSQQRLGEAESYLEQAKQRFISLTQRTDRQLEDLHDLGICWLLLGDLAAMSSDEAGLQIAVERYEEAQRVLDGLVIENSSVYVYRGTLALARLNLANAYERQKKPHEAFDRLASAFDEFQMLAAKDEVYRKYSAKAFFEMLRLRKWNKLSEGEQKVLADWLDFALKDNGEAWVRNHEKLAASAAEFPPLPSLEDSELVSGKSSRNR